MKIDKKVFGKVLLIAVLVLGASLAKSAYAMTPTVSAVYSGSGDSVQINVNGDANTNAVLYFNGSSGLSLQPLGNTNSSGSISTTISSGQYGIQVGSSAYVVVNGQQSSSVTWPTFSTNSNGGSSTLTLSQTGVVMSVGQSSTITANNNTGSSLYVSNNSNPVVANINLNGNQVTINAIAQGSTVFTVCSSTTNCASVYVTVQNSGVAALSFSQSNVTVASGQTVSVTITGGTGVYTVLSNSNPSVIQTNVVGSILNISTNSTYGSATLTICSSNQVGCGIITAAAGTVSSTGVTFSQSNPSIAIGQTTTVSLYGGSNYTVSSNSNTSVVQGTISNNTLTLFGISSGTATVTICQSSGSCGTLTATVTGAGSGGNITLSQSSINILTGQTLTVTISGGSVPYSLPAFSSNIFSASLNGNVITITGVASGSSLLTVCSASGGCTTLSVTVNSNGTYTTNNNYTTNTNTTTGSSIVLSQAMSVGQSIKLLVSGAAGSYYLSSNAGNIVSANLIGSLLTLTGARVGSDSVSVCSTGSSCLPISVTVNPAVAGSVTASVLPPASSIITSANTSVFKFLKPLRFGMTDPDVTQLQNRLTAEGLYTGPITGYYGNLTVTAVKAYQTKYGLTPLGSVGPGTRDELNK